MAPAPTTPTRTGAPGSGGLIVIWRGVLRGAAGGGPASAAAPRRLVQAALGAGDELDQVVDVRVGRQLAAHAVDRLGGVEPGAHQDAHRLVELGQALGRVALAPQPDLVEAVAGRLQA